MAQETAAQRKAREKAEADAVATAAATAPNLATTDMTGSAPAVDPAAEMARVTAEIEAERARLLAEVNAEVDAIRVAKMADIMDEDADEDERAAGVPVMDVTVPGGAYIINGVWVNANGQPLPESLAREVASMHEANAAAADAAYMATVEASVSRQSTIFRRALAGITG